MTAKYKEFN